MHFNEFWKSEIKNDKIFFFFFKMKKYIYQNDLNINEYWSVNFGNLKTIFLTYSKIVFYFI